jgi:shikimate dehydrogenase
MKLYGLIGFPLAHSFSARYFTQKFEQEGLTDSLYHNFEISDVSEIKNILRKHPQLLGLNVTIPHKQSIINLLDEIHPDVEAIGAVNVIRVTDGKTVGYNTDAIGFKNSLKGWLPNTVNGALVLGTGGASKAIVHVLKQMGITTKIVSRKAGADLNYESMDEAIMQQHQFIINCTPVGTSPNLNECPPIPYQFLSKNHYLFDLVYNPAETLFLKKGIRQNAKIKNGFEMLVLQADAAWEIWNAENK